MVKCENRPSTIGHITLDAKQTGAPSAGNPHAGCDVAGAGNGFTVLLLRHSQRKRGETARRDLRNTAPVLDPTVQRPEFAVRTVTERFPVQSAFTVTDLQDICKGVSSGQLPCGLGGSFRSISRSPGFRPVLRIRVRGKGNLLLSFEGCQALCEHLVDRGVGIAA
jgi:hypothetical protein